MAGSKNSRKDDAKVEAEVGGKDVEMVVRVGDDSDPDTDDELANVEPPNPVSRVLFLSLVVLILGAVALDQPWYQGSSTRTVSGGAAARATQTSYELRVGNIILEDSTPTQRTMDYDQLVLLQTKSVMSVVQGLQIIVVVSASFLFALAAWQFTDLSPRKQKRVDPATKWVYFRGSKYLAFLVVFLTLGNLLVPLALKKTLKEDDVVAQVTGTLNTAAGAGNAPTATCGTMTNIPSIDCNNWWGTETTTTTTNVQIAYRTFPTVAWWMNWLNLVASFFLFSSTRQAIRGDFNLYRK